MFESAASTVSELRSALDEFRAAGWRDLSDVALADRLDEIERAVRILEAERGLGVFELERRRTYAADGHLSAAAWLSHRQGISRRSAERGRSDGARALEQMPEVARALGEGEVSSWPSRCSRRLGRPRPTHSPDRSPRSWKRHGRWRSASCAE